MSNEVAIDERLNRAGISLQSPGTPVALYVPWVQAGNLIFVSGHIAKREGLSWVGQLGRTMDTATGVQAARAVAVDLLGTLQAAAENLTRVKRIVKLLCLVNSTPDYIEHHIVANGCSELFEYILGSSGKHARSAFGVSQLPTGACVEVELIAELR